MKLYLSGGGSGKQNLYAYINYFKSIDKTKPILYVPLAMEEEKYDSCYEWFKKEISAFNITDFKMIRSSKELSTINLNDYNSIFIGGGNTYKLLDEIRKYDNDKKIINYLNNNGIIYGGSAGAIIFGKDIDTCRIMDKKMDIKTEGLNLINGYSLLCHLKNKNLKKNKQYLEEYSKNNKVLFLPEEDVLVVEENNIKIIGNKKYYLFVDGKSIKHSIANFKKDIKK